MSAFRVFSAGFCLVAFGAMSFATDLTSIFRQLDSDGNGVVTRDEISKSQEPFFNRALRVGDLNQDGNLAISELEAATRDPEPQEVSAGDRRGMGRGQMADGLQRLDRNNDGKLSRDEVPQALQQRLNPIFERSGRDEIGLRELAQFAQRMANNQPGTRPSETPGTQSQPMQDGDFISGIMRRLDRDQDGQLSGSEFTRAPEFLKLLDANNDDRITRDEITIPDRRRTTPQMQRDAAPGQRENNTPGRQTRNPDQLFRLFDKDNDGKIAISDLPERAQNALKRADRNNDGYVSREEVDAAAARR